MPSSVRYLSVLAVLDRPQFGEVRGAAVDYGGGVERVVTADWAVVGAEGDQPGALVGVLAGHSVEQVAEGAVAGTVEMMR